MKEIREYLKTRLAELKKDKSISSLERQEEVLDIIILIQNIQLKNIKNEL